MTGRTVHRLGADGFVCDWLAGPAWSAPCDDLDAVLDGDGSPWGADGRWVLTNGPDVAPLKQRLHARRPLVLDQPLPDVVEGGELRWTAPGKERVDAGAWRRVHTGADGLVDWSAFCFTPEYRHAVAATLLEVDQSEWRTLEVHCTGPFALWVGEELLAVGEDVAYMEPLRREVRVRMRSGTTRIVLATWQVAFRECRHVAGLRVVGLPVQVVLPSPGADEYAAATAEQVLDGIAVRSWAVADGVARLTGSAGAALVVAQDGHPPTRVRLTPAPDVAGVGQESHFPALWGQQSGFPALPAGAADVPVRGTGEAALTVRLDDPRAPVERTLQVAVLPPRRRSVPDGGDPSTWRAEVLQHVAAGTPGIARALAAHELTGTAVGAADLDRALWMLTSRADCADFEAVGLLHLLHRVAAEAWAPGLRERAVAALLTFKYWIDQPGLDAMCYFTENHQFVWHTAELLAGELLAREAFANTGWAGARHAEHGREFAVAWMRRKLAGGFSEFDSNAYLAIDALALVSLVELAADVDVRQLAEALLDKTLLTLAANSWRGVHGAAHGRSYVTTLRSSRFEETAPMMWALWGTGSLNAAALPATAMCLARAYQLPPLIRAVATELPEEWYGRQVYRGTHRFTADLLSRPYGSDLHVWRTPDAMLSSVQDYRAGLPGLQEHVWGATLGAEVQVFVTCPAAATTSSSARPNAWAGQRVLPRVRQHRDVVLAVHGEGGTHAWFPAPLMDEVRQRRSWLAGRVGDGYVALATPCGLRAAVAGEDAGQAWLPRGDGRAYVATVGRRAVDGSFADFVDALPEPVFDGDRVAVNTGRHHLELGWTGPFLVDGAAAGLDADGRPEQTPHLDNPAVRVPLGAATLEATWGGQRMVLDLAAGRRVEPATALTVIPTT
ncbi:hypothetical protein WEH80_11365 [Actinomycetes bacterium KLBMP 9759]